MIDLVKLHLQAGHGGNGRVSFRREKYVRKGGPDGGNGGDGGSIILRGVEGLSSLQHLTNIKNIAAQPGQSGGKQKRSGIKGESRVVEVPVGTRVWLLAENEPSWRRRQRYGLEALFNRDDIEIEKYYLETIGQAPPKNFFSPVKSILESSKLLKKIINGQNELLRKIDFKTLPKQELIEITEPGQEIVLCQGGIGGRGNTTFKSSINTTPLEAEKGTPGEEKVVVFEQLLLADVGLVGFPNAGKSTLISVITQARPKVGNYPFTTLEPHLGLVRSDLLGEAGKELVIADIPGLVTGASQGKGLGHAFLRHTEHCRVLLFVLYLPEEVIFNDELSLQEKAEALWEQFLKLRTELDEYGPELANKKFLLGVNKSDLYSEELQQEIQAFFEKKKHDEKLLFFSGATQAGIKELLRKL